jgi:hypothetical protein
MPKGLPTNQIQIQPNYKKKPKGSKKIIEDMKTT